MELKIRMYALIFCLLVVGVCTQCFVSMYARNGSVVADEAMSKLHTSGTIHFRGLGRHRG